MQNCLDPTPLVQPSAISLRLLRRMVGQEMHGIKAPLPHRLSDRAKFTVQFVTGARKSVIAQPGDKNTLRHNLLIQDFLLSAKFYVIAGKPTPPLRGTPPKRGFFLSPPWRGGPKGRGGFLFASRQSKENR